MKFFCKIMFRRFFYDTINIIRRTFCYGKTKETCTSSTNDRRKTRHHPSAPGRIRTSPRVTNKLANKTGGKTPALDMPFNNCYI